ncbi:MAG TPA: sigma-54 dependent transcriptional regulator [Oligoflexia bacterium]|nr:sigma-54 dependent transcriptional regulator [Oligoflexia bacterium]HMP26952.1 sigma-54 dependent transcriptional regulator [Oligoflexia bacterium]
MREKTSENTLQISAGERLSLLALRTLILVVGTGAYIWLYYIENLQIVIPLYLKLLGLAILGTTSILTFYRQNYGEGFWSIRSQALFDGLLATQAIYFTGGPSSPISVIFLIALMWSSFKISRAELVLLSLVYSLFYLSLLSLLSLSLLPPLGEAVKFIYSQDGIVLEIIRLCSGMILISFLTNLLVSTLKQSRQTIDASYKQAEELLSERRQLEAQLNLHETIARLLSSSSNSAGAPISGLIGKSDAIKKVNEMIAKVAQSEATVLISGESGTGKELAARAIHLSSMRKDFPFVPVNCGAIPENLLESQLFGHKRGSFTGADSDFPGLFKQAENGTIFLDEIGELPLHLQAKILRALQERAVQPVGGMKEVPINVRIIAATNRILKNEVSKGLFREDLFYRLNVVNIELPPLRERRDDLPLLIQSLLQKITASEREIKISPSAMNILSSYSYPGNVRELENILERALVLGGDAILPEHLPENLSRAAQGINDVNNHLGTKIFIRDDLVFPVSLDEVLSEIEKHYLEVALVRTKGIKKRAAELLGMNFRSFRYRLQKFGIGDNEDEEELGESNIN